VNLLEEQNCVHLLMGSVLDKSLESGKQNEKGLKEARSDSRLRKKSDICTLTRSPGSSDAC
jgi:hypothetical protein